VLSIGDLIRRARSSLGRRISVGAALLAVLALCVRPPWGERFDPEEHWKEVAEAIESIFPDGTSIFPTLGALDRPEPRWRDFLHAHMLRPAAFPGSPAFDREAFLAGRMIVHERPYRESEHFSSSSLPPGAIAIRFRQNYIGYQSLWLVPPRDSGIESVRDASGNVVSNASPWNALCRCELLIRTASPPRSLVLVWDRASNRAPRVIPSDGSIVRTEQRDAVTLVTFVPSAPLALETNGSRRLTVDPAVPQSRLLRAWAYPVR
jgi:hypothetical protein